jgi:protein TonB
LVLQHRLALLLQRPPSVVDIVSPPSIEETPVEAVAVATMPIDVAKPIFGIPVPVPDLIGLDKTLPDLRTPMTSPHFGDTTSTIDDKSIVNFAVTPFQEHKEIQKQPIPDRTVFIDFNEDPVPVQSIQQLVVYPEVARLSHIEGKVIASVYIGTDGRPEKVIIEKSDNEIFNRSAEEALLKTRFTPARQDKTPVAVWWTVPISYKLTR